MKILLIRLRLLGDVVLTTPAIRAIRARYPQARISYLVEPLAADVLRHNPHIDELILVDRSRGFGRLSTDLALARRLRAAAFDLVIDFHGGPRSMWLTRATGAPRRIGYEGFQRSWAYTDRCPRQMRVRHSVLNQWDLLAPLGITDSPEPFTAPLEMPLDRAAAARIDPLLEGLADIIVLHAGVTSPFRRWPVRECVELARLLLLGHPDRGVVLVGAVDSQSDAGEIQRGFGGRVRNLAGRLSVAELRAVIDRASLYIGVDSGPMHVAATTNTPVVALFGPALPGVSGPWRSPNQGSIDIVAVDGLPCRPCDQRRCVPGDFRCMTWISAREVAARAERILGQPATMSSG